MGLEEVFESTAFYILTGVGWGAFVLMLIVLKGMGNQEIMPWWVKILVFIVVPLIAALFSGYAEG